MKRFFQTIKNIFSIEDLRIRILNTIGFLIVFRLGSFIVIPGIEPNLLDPQRNAGGILGFLNNFLGGAFNNASIFALGIMPYISASIIVQLLSFAVPYFQKLQNNTQNINPRHSSNGGEMASQMDENKSAAVPAGFVAEEENSPIRPDLP